MGYAWLMGVAALILLLFAIETPETKNAFERYIRLSEERMNADLSGERFLALSAEQKQKLRSGDMLITSHRTLDQGKEIKIPGGMVQDWLGLMFIPGAKLVQIRETLQNYDDYKKFYAPEVIESKVLDHKGEDYDIFLRLYKKQFITVVLNATYHVHYGEAGASRLYITSRSTRIAEVKNAKKSYTEENPPGHDLGLLWALNSYWRFEEAADGVYAQLEAISLSRDIPFGLGWLKGWLQHFPRDSMENTLTGTRRAVESLRSVRH